MRGPARSEQELKGMCMEWYIKFGEREVIVPSEDVDLDIELMNYGLVEWNDMLDLDTEVFTTRLTPKALEIIKGTTDETKT